MVRPQRESSLISAYNLFRFQSGMARWPENVLSSSMYLQLRGRSGFGQIL